MATSSATSTAAEDATPPVVALHCAGCAQPVLLVGLEQPQAFVEELMLRRGAALGVLRSAAADSASETRRGWLGLWGGREGDGADPTVAE